MEFSGTANDEATGDPTTPPRVAPARGVPLRDLPDGGMADLDTHAKPAPEYEFDRRLTW